MPALAAEGAGSDSSFAVFPSTNAPFVIMEVHNSETVPDTDLWFELEDMGTGTPLNSMAIFLEATVDCY
jgi:hypothetical protein